MNHRPFEDWLLDDQPLTIQQERELVMHLHACPSCSAIANSNLALHSIRWVAPPPGFTDRFTVRLNNWQRAQRGQQIMGTLVLVISGLLLIYRLAIPVILDALQSPATWIATATNYLVFILSTVRLFGAVSGILLRDLPGLISPTGWVSIVCAATGASFVWAISMRRMARIPQGV
jgi:hypothetical protein